jgi:6-pyruvoyltetrahydropterin/6-carboxytetrahydropterin synthase
MEKFESTKVFDGYSVALRQHKAQHSHCCLLHGYGIYFKVTFAPIDTSVNAGLDEMNWVQDYGSFKRNGLKDWLADMFDHTVLIEQDDPMRPLFEEFGQYKIGKVHFLEKMGMEHLAKLVFDKFNDTLSKQDGGRVKVVQVEAFEHEKNSSIYRED